MKRRVLMVILAVTLGLVGAGTIFAYLKNTDNRAVAGKQPATVLVVAKRIPAGTTMKSVIAGGYVKADKVPASAKPADALARLSDVKVTDVALADVQTGGVVVREMFGRRPPATSGLTIPDGMVAVSISVSSSADVAGYVQPGSEVAVFDTFVTLDAKGTPAGTKDQPNRTDNWATKLLLSRVPVLAVSQAAPTGTQVGVAAESLLVTIAVNQRDAERVIHVAHTGSLYLALLSDHSMTKPSPGVDNQGRLGTLFGGASQAGAQ
ncbi:MAG: pilus assembly protein CpaB [Pseudonocardiales bacterium]|jgi:pilus assembly protein CpaB|nr:pilus assembly protein CpaB [Pseudonocardiales bacterium]